jgi:uncharacterized protein YcaQ
LADKPVRVSLVEARRLAIIAQHLDGPLPRPTRAAAMKIVRDIGYLQLDPTNVVARNPYLVLWSRLGRYDPKLLDDLLFKHRTVFEGSSLILPTSDLALHAEHTYGANAAGRRGPAAIDTWRTRNAAWLAKNTALRRTVLARLRRDGPLPLTAFEGRSVLSWTYGDVNAGQNVGLLLAILLRRGEVVVAGRRRGHRLWGLAEGWFPKVPAIPRTERPVTALKRSLRALGLATPKQLEWYYAFNHAFTRDDIKKLERAGEIVPVEVEGLPGRYLATPDITRRAKAARERFEGRTTLLSPFDNLIHDRDRLDELFSYFYRIEIYTPVAKRRLGFWAMPVLHGDQIVGSVDPRLDREAAVLTINRVVMQKGAQRSAGPAIRRAVDDLAAFVGATEVRWPRHAP